MVQLGFQLPTYGQQPKKKEEEQMMSKAPMMSVASPVKSKPTAPATKPIGSKANVSSGIPREPMMSYKIEGTILPGVTDKTAKNLQKYAKENAKTPEEEKLLLSDMYQAAVKEQQRKAYLKDREEMKGQMIQKSLSATDPEEKKSIDTAVKLANLSDVIREGAKKSGVDLFEMNDKDVVAGFGESNPDKQEVIINYLNGKIDSVEVGKQIGFIPTEEEAPVEETPLTAGQKAGAFGKEFGGGILEQAVGTITSTAGKDPKDWRSRMTGVPSPTGALTPIIEKMGDAVQQKIDESMTEQEKGSGWATAGKVTAVVLPILASFMGAGPKNVKGAIKSIGNEANIAKTTEGMLPKKVDAISSMIQEQVTTKNKINAGSRLKVPKQNFLQKKGILKTPEATIDPTENITRAEGVIKRDIPTPSENPVTLREQIRGVISSMSNKLRPNLRKIKTGTMTKMKAEVNNNLEEVKTLTDQFTNADIKKISNIQTKVKQVKNLEELWDIAIEYDKQFSSAVKNANEMSAPTTQKANLLWQSGRKVLRNAIDETAGKVSDLNVKEQFKDMSSLYEADHNIQSKLGELTSEKPGILTKDKLLKRGGGTILGGTLLKYLFGGD